MIEHAPHTTAVLEHGVSLWTAVFFCLLLQRGTGGAMIVLPGEMVQSQGVAKNSMGHLWGTQRQKTVVSHLLHARELNTLGTFLYKIRNVAGEVLHRLIDLNVVLPSSCRPDSIMVFLQPAQQPHP